MAELYVLVHHDCGPIGTFLTARDANDALREFGELMIGRPRDRFRSVIVYGVASAETEQVLEFFPDREAAEAFIAEVTRDEPETATSLCIEPVEFQASAN